MCQAKEIYDCLTYRVKSVKYAEANIKNTRKGSDFIVPV